uniref:Uncharacterized protein n=1 Tax=Globodera pallida TaxID=36090 RepID=A0A183C5F1_GLOPA
MCSQSSSISNPFFFHFPTAATATAAGVISSTDRDSLLEKGATPIVGTRAAGALAGAKGGGGGRGTATEGLGEWKRVQYDHHDQHQKLQKQCCVANPFRREFESQLNHSSPFPTSVALSESAFCFSFGTESAQTAASDAKLLMDSGYRSITSNSTLDEELAVAERQRRAERERRRAETKRKSNCKVPSLAPTINADNNSVPNFLRRTCSTAANGLSGLTMTNWVGGGESSRNDGGTKPPRRTKSVGVGRIPTANLYGTGWMVAAELSSSDDSPEGMEKRPTCDGDRGGRL